MTITKALKDQPSASTDNNVDLFMLDASKWLLLSHEPNGKNGTKAVYVYNNGNTAFRTLLEITAGTTIVNGKPRNRGQIKVIPVLLATDSETTLITLVDSAEFWLGFSVPADATVLPADVMKWLETTVGVLAPTVTSGVIGTTVLESLIRGYSKIYA